MYNSVHFTKGETKKERCRYANLKKSYLMSRMKLVVLSGGVGKQVSRCRCAACGNKVL